MLIYLWPVLLPVVVYLGWLWLARRKARVSGHDVLPGLKDGPWVWMVAASLLIGIACFLLLGLGGETKRYYRPAELRDGTLIEGETR